MKVDVFITSGRDGTVLKQQDFQLPYSREVEKERKLLTEEDIEDEEENADDEPQNEESSDDDPEEEE